MRRTRAIPAAGAAVLVLAVGGAVAVSADGEHPAPRYGTSALSDDLTPTQRQAIEAMQSDSPIPVQDASGTPRGFVRDSALVARDERVTDVIIKGFREPKGPVDEDYNHLFEALRILDPVAVVDADGTTVGYWTHHFKEIDELEKLTPEAQATVDRLLR